LIYSRAMKCSVLRFRGSVANMLVTSCLDNICRLWSETHLPEDAGIPHSLNDENSESSGIRPSAKLRIQKQKTRYNLILGVVIIFLFVPKYAP